MFVWRFSCEQASTTYLCFVALTLKSRFCLSRSPELGERGCKPEVHWQNWEVNMWDHMNDYFLCQHHINEDIDDMILIIR